MKLTAIGVILLLAGGAAVLAGILPVHDVLQIGDRVWPILVFVIAVTVVAELAATAGVFDVTAAYLARAAHGRTWVLWGLVVLLAAVATAFLSLDTTAVLLTPVVVSVAKANGLRPLPFAFATVWLANTASLVLPVSNLTNLLAVHRLGIANPAQFLALLGGSALVSIVITVVALILVFRRDLGGRYRPMPAPGVADRALLVVAAIVVVVLLPLLVTGIAPWIPATGAAAVLALFFAWRSPGSLRLSLLPWQLVVFAAGLFLAVGALEAIGSSTLLVVATGAGHDLPALWRLAGTGLVGANVVNNLPAYLALEPTTGSPARLAALLVGVNAGPLITPWASLATLLWHQRLHAVGVEVPWRRYILLGLVVAPTTVALAVLPLALAG